MSQPLRVEDSDRISHISSRTIQSRLWFINNKRLEHDMLAYTARLQDRHGTKLFAMSLMGNHHHFVASFEDGTRADFNRDFKSQFQRKLKASEIAGFEGGPLWYRRFDEQELPRFEDAEHYFWYVVMQEVRGGQCDRIEDCDTYNCFFDAIAGIEREFEYFDEASYRRARKRNPAVRREKFVERHRLRFARLPGYKGLSKEDYRAMMMEKYPIQLAIALKERAARGYPKAVSKSYLRRMKPGSYPRSTKVSSRSNPRPIVLTLCAETRKACLTRYEFICLAHHNASQKFQDGELDIEFPEGTYRPPLYLFGRLARRRARERLRLENLAV